MSIGELFPFWLAGCGGLRPVGSPAYRLVEGGLGWSATSIRIRMSPAFASGGIEAPCSGAVEDDGQAARAVDAANTDHLYVGGGRGP